TRSRVELYGEAAQVLCKAVCTWAGIPISTAVRLQLTRDCLQQVSDGAVGAPWGQSRKARERTQRWAEDVIERIRQRRLLVPMSCPASVIAHSRMQGCVLPPNVAAEILLDVVRPTIGLAR